MSPFLSAEITTPGSLPVVSSRTVVARIECVPREPENIIDSIVRRFEESEYVNFPYNSSNACPGTFISSSSECFHIRDYYIGIARCNEGDAFDVEFGKKLALERARKKYHTAVHAQLVKFGMYFGNMFEKIAVRAVQECERIEETYSVIDDLFAEKGWCLPDRQNKTCISEAKERDKT